MMARGKKRVFSAVLDVSFGAIIVFCRLFVTLKIYYYEGILGLSMNYQSTIVAQCTPSGLGAIALVRVSGSNAVAITDAVARLPRDKKLGDQQTHTIHYGFVVDPQGQHIDQVLFLLMRAPQTFTGEDTVEITCHNNPFIIKQIIDQLCAHGARVAQQGEFSRQAVENNKIDILQAEAINELIHANTHQALATSLAQVEGSFSSWLVSLEKKLVTALAFSEASFEFIDEEDLAFAQQIRQLVDQVLATVQALKKTFEAQKQIRDGIHIAVIGSVNAGKSSLFNALLGADRAIVTPIAGTTRDTIEAGRYKDGQYQTFIDTAGLRQTQDIVEQKGIERSHQCAALADIIILVFDGSRLLTVQEEVVYASLLQTYSTKVIQVRNKADMPLLLQSEYLVDAMIPHSVGDQQSLDALESKIACRAEQLMHNAQAPFMLNQRHHERISALEQNLNVVQTFLKEPVQYELVSHHLKEALSELAGLTGKTISEQGIDAVFRQFCVGK
jgi:tRNA modification GTPase